MSKIPAAGDKTIVVEYKYRDRGQAVLRFFQRILWCLLLLVMCSSVIWAQERVYGPGRVFSLVLPPGWTTSVDANTLVLSKQRAKASLRLRASIRDTPSANQAVDSWGQRIPSDGEVLRAKRPGGQFTYMELTDYSEEKLFTVVASTVSQEASSKSEDSGYLEASYFSRYASVSEVKELMSAFWSFRFENGSGTVPSKTGPNTPEDDF